MRRVAALCVLMLAAVGVALAPLPAAAEPYIAVQQGYKCEACHVNPTGGGLRNAFGTVFTENVLPQSTLPASLPVWSGTVFKALQVGADWRWADSSTAVPNEGSTKQSGVEQLRAYANLTVVPGYLTYYVDEQLDPGQPLALEYYARLSDATHGLYLKAGEFYLPFGWRLQDNTAFVREFSGISMTTPDKGFELGLERPEWSAQLDYTRGEANISTGSGHELTSQVVYVKPQWRVGLAASFTQSTLGNREVQGLFVGRRTGPIAWLGEVDLIRDAGFPGSPRRLLAMLGEADWALAKGQNLKLTGEYADPDLSVANDQETRWSLLYEYTPIPFLQLRAGFRRYRGIPQNDLENRRLLFLEVHAFL